MDSKSLQLIKAAYAHRQGPIYQLILDFEQLLNAAQDAYGVMEYISCHYYPQDTELRDATDALGIAIDRAMGEETCPAEEVAPLPNPDGK